MTRFRRVLDLTKGTISDVPYTLQEEADADAAKAADDLDQAPVLLQQQRTAAVRANARRQMLVTAIQNNDDAGLITAMQARYPGLTGDAAKFAVDVTLLVAGVIRN